MSAEALESLVCGPGPSERTVRTADGRVLTVPVGWELLPPGDAGLTRRVKASSVTWTVQEKKGRKLFSRGVWVAAGVISKVQAELDRERSTESYAKKQATALVRREKKQSEYVEDFYGAVLGFLRFTPRYVEIAQLLAEKVTKHATPVGSGTVARTERIPIEQRAESAVIAWMRHATTSYDEMKIARVKGERREVRRMLAEQSRRVLERYRRGEPVTLATCPLQRALFPAAASAKGGTLPIEAKAKRESNK